MHMRIYCIYKTLGEKKLRNETFFENKTETCHFKSNKKLRKNNI